MNSQFMGDLTMFKFHAHHKTYMYIDGHKTFSDIDKLLTNYAMKSRQLSKQSVFETLYFTT